MEWFTFRVALTLGQNGCEIEQTAAATFTSNYSFNFKLVNAVIALTNTNQPVNGSFCQITSLEVYRGSMHSTEISHRGFSLSSEGTLEVNQMHEYNEYTDNIISQPGGNTKIYL
jgi:hypothetical protein